MCSDRFVFRTSIQYRYKNPLDAGMDMINRFNILEISIIYRYSISYQFCMTVFTYSKAISCKQTQITPREIIDILQQ